MKTLLAGLAAVLAPLSLFALPNYDPFANATGSGGTAYGIGTWLSQNDSAVVGIGQKDATAGQWYHAGAVANNSPTIVSGNVTYPGLAGSSGNSVLVGNNTTADLATGRYAPPGIDLGSTTAGFRYYSF